MVSYTILYEKKTIENRHRHTTIDMKFQNIKNSNENRMQFFRNMQKHIIKY